MGDLLTQLQDEVYMMSDLFGISIGVLQRDAPAIPLMNHSSSTSAPIGGGVAAGAPPGGNDNQANAEKERALKREEFNKVAKGSKFYLFLSFFYIEISTFLFADMALNLIQRAIRIESLIDRLPGVNRTEPQQYQRLDGKYLFF